MYMEKVVMQNNQSKCLNNQQLAYPEPNMVIATPVMTDTELTINFASLNKYINLIAPLLKKTNKLLKEADSNRKNEISELVSIIQKLFNNEDIKISELRILEKELYKYYDSGVLDKPIDEAIFAVSFGVLFGLCLAFSLFPLGSFSFQITLANVLCFAVVDILLILFAHLERQIGTASNLALEIKNIGEAANLKFFRSEAEKEKTDRNSLTAVDF